MLRLEFGVNRRLKRSLLGPGNKVLTVTFQAEILLTDFARFLNHTGVAMVTGACCLLGDLYRLSIPYIG